MQRAMAAIDPCLIWSGFLSFNSAVETLDRNDSTADRGKPEGSSNTSSPAGPGSKKHSLRFIIPVLQLCTTATGAQGGISGEK